VTPRRQRVADGVGLAVVLLVLLDYLRPPLLLLSTIAAGGDTPCHYPTAVHFHEHLLPHLRLHGWYAGAYLGHPLLLYYFPFPFLVMSALAPAVGMPVAFKLGSALGVLLLPLLAYASFRLLGFRFPAPLMAAAASLVFLLLEDNPIWGGTLASMLTGEFAYAYGIAFAVLFLGVVYRAYGRGRSPWLPAAALALTALAHGYAVQWAGLSASYFLYRSRAPARTLRWLASVAALGFALGAFFLVPLLADWRWTTDYDDPHITAGLASLSPPLLLPLLGLAVLGLGGTLLFARRTGGPDHRLLFLIHSAVVAAALAVAAPAIGVIGVRYLPFGQLALCLAGAATLGLLLQRLAASDLAALGLVLVAVLYGDAVAGVARHWPDWNYSGLEARELWPAFRRLSETLRGTVADPRVAVEYHQEHERAGSIRVYETLPYFSGRSTIEGVYNQASLQTHAVYYLSSELSATSPKPFRSREYSTFDTENALRHLRLFNVREVVALSPQLVSALETRDDLEEVTRIDPYRVFRLRDPGPGYVEPLAFAPVRSSPRGWRDKAYRWFARKPASPVHLVFSDDPRFEVVERDEYLLPPAVPLPGGVVVRSRLEAESLTIETNRVGHPLLVKVSYHPRWRALGADGPYLVSPALMMVIPREPRARLVYASSTGADRLGLAVTVAAALGALARGLRRRRPSPSGAAIALPGDACDLPPPTRRWGGFVSGGVLLALGVAGVLTPASHAPREGEAAALLDRASRAYASRRLEDAAEYASQAASFRSGPEVRGALLALRGESLLRLGRAREAAAVFEELTGFPPYRPQALCRAGEAYESVGDARAAAVRERLAREFPGTPWARRLAAGGRT
jgi:hypothetical protein